MLYTRDGPGFRYGFDMACRSERALPAIFNEQGEVIEKVHIEGNERETLPFLLTYLTGVYTFRFGFFRPCLNIILPALSYTVGTLAGTFSAVA